MGGDAGAADAAAEAQEHLARVKALGHRWVRLHLAAVLLRQEVARYRDAHQGPIVERANALFPKLTLGRYSGVRVGFGEGDDPVLLCVRPDGSDVGVGGLSDGTRDALYLALRLATIERFAAHHEPMPLVLDDVLIHFDDERARAALSVLGDLAGTMQVLFFTHHARLRNLAREAVPPERLREHELAAPRTLADAVAHAEE